MREQNKFPLVSVIIPTRNEGNDAFKRCLSSVKNQTYPNIEIIVVDNNSSDNTKEIALKYTSKVFNYGNERSSQRNFAVKKAKGDYIFSLDVDQELPENSVEEAMKKMKGNDAVFIFDLGIGTTFWSKAHAFEKAIHFKDSSVTSPRLFRKDKFLEIGGFDENLVVNEDLELFLRMKEAGFKVGYSDILINHYEGGNLTDVFNKSSYYGRTALAFLKKSKSKGWKIHLIYHPLAYLKNWKYFLKHPIYGTASVIRKSVTYLGGIHGMLWKYFDKLEYRLIRSLLTDKPAYAIFFITSKCNLKCKHCFFWKELNNTKNELSTIEFEKISKGFNNLIYLNLTGGEPFLRNDLDKICFFFYKNSGTKFIAISTNGSLPEKIKEKVNNILNSCRGVNLNIAISLDELGKKHDEFRGVKGIFEKVLNSIKNLKEIQKKYPNLKIIINTPFSTYNQNSIKKLFDYVKKLGVSHHRIGLLRNDTKDEKLKKISFDKYEKLLKYMNENKIESDYPKIFRVIHRMNLDVNLKTAKKNKRILPCVAGRKLLVIRENGDMFPCEIINKKMGNLRNFNYNIDDLLKNKNIKKMIKIINKKCFCTWGCATQNNVIFNKRNYPKIIYNLLKGEKFILPEN